MAERFVITADLARKQMPLRHELQPSRKRIFEMIRAAAADDFPMIEFTEKDLPGVDIWVNSPGEATVARDIAHELARLDFAITSRTWSRDDNNEAPPAMIVRWAEDLK